MQVKRSNASLLLFFISFLLLMSIVIVYRTQEKGTQIIFNALWTLLFFTISYGNISGTHTMTLTQNYTLVTISRMLTYQLKTFLCFLPRFFV